MCEEQVSVPMTTEGVLAFDMNCSLRYFLMTPADGTFAVLHEANYYCLLAGPRSFVSEALGKPPEIIFDEFVSEYVNLGDWPVNTLAMLREVERYRELL